MKSSSISLNGNRNNTRWCKLVLSALIPCILGIFTIVFAVQQQSLSRQQHEIDQQNQRDAQQQTLFDAYINDISNLLLHSSDSNKTNETKLLLHIRTKTLTALRNLNPERKKYIILFLYESGFLQGSDLDLSGADLNDVQLIGPYKLDRLYLPNVSWKNALFIECSLIKAVFDQSCMSNARFIDSLLESASFPATVLDHVYFIRTSVLSINFTGASLVRANFLDANVVQDIDFSNADLFHAQFTEDQFQGKRVNTVPHSFRHARLPNGSFGTLNSRRNLVKNGDAEMECETSERNDWRANEIINGSSIIKLNDTSVTNIINDNHNWGNCTFVVMMKKARVSQFIDLSLYSRVIDMNEAMFSSSAFFGCNGSTNAGYLEVSVHGLDGNILEKPVYLNRTEDVDITNGLMHQYGIQRHRLLKHTPKVRISFGARSTLQAGIFCYFDNITFTIQKN